MPCSFEESGDFYQTPEIAVTLSLLEIIDNPRQDVPLIAVLALPGVRLCAGPCMAEIRSHDREGDFYDALLADGGEDVQAFLTHPDRPAGSGGGT